MSPTLSLPLADIADVVKNLLPIIFIVLYGVAQLVGNIQKEKRKAAAPRPKPVLPPPDPAAGGARNVAPGNPTAGNQPTLEETLRREVEEFLRRAEGGQPQQPKAQPHARSNVPNNAQRPAIPSVNLRAPEQPSRSPRRLVDTRRRSPPRSR